MRKAPDGRQHFAVNSGAPIGHADPLVPFEQIAGVPEVGYFVKLLRQLIERSGHVGKSGCAAAASRRINSGRREWYHGEWRSMPLVEPAVSRLAHRRSPMPVP